MGVVVVQVNRAWCSVPFGDSMATAWWLSSGKSCIGVWARNGCKMHRAEISLVLAPAMDFSVGVY